ncbi:MAG TPA: hypothetical protein VNJ54_14085 [Plantibacter sp.]|uniref:DUF7882 family protein n=1 Tax=unclassified Plantibacter TaxID=2624265 RepID=UPI002CBAF178|nr:hypothetical protein [Plantibacter sp.]
MGLLIYASGDEYEIEDRALAHLKAVIGSKLRRQESFFLSWANDAEHGSGRRSVWLSPSIPLQFRFFGSRAPELNRAWIEVLSDTAHTPRGLQLIPESEIEGYLAETGALRDSAETHDHE